MLMACRNDEVRSLEAQLSSQGDESMQKEATLRDIVESRMQTIRELSDDKQELELRCAFNIFVLAAVDLHLSTYWRFARPYLYATHPTFLESWLLVRPLQRPWPECRDGPVACFENEMLPKF